MSFSKAKLHRFNEEISCTPPPGAYNPKLDTKVKGSVIEKSKRFLSPNISHSSTESLDSIGSASSIKLTGNVPVFRTPQLNRKVVTLQNVRSHSVCGRSTKSKEDISINMLREENTKLKTEIKLVKDELVTETNRFTKDYKMREDELQKIIEEKNGVLKLQHEDLNKLKDQCDKLCQSLKLERENYEKFINELHQKNGEKSDLCDMKQGIILNLENELANVKQDMDKLVVKHEKELKTLADTIELNFEVFDQHVQKRVLDLEGDFETAKMELQVDMEMNLCKFTTDFEAELRTLNSNYLSLSNIVKQNENSVNDKINEFTINTKEADDRCKFLFQELCKVEKERDDLIGSDLEKNLTLVEMQDKCSELENNLKLASEECRRYKISVNNMQKTIKALRDRLFESESEVERLNAVEQNMQSQNITLEEKVKGLVKQQSNLKNNMEHMEKEIIHDVIKVKNDLVERLEIIKTESQKEITYLKEVAVMKDQDIINKSEGILNLQLQIDTLLLSQQKVDRYVNILEVEKKDLEVQLFEMTEKHFNLQKLLKEKEEKIESLENDFNQWQDDRMKIRGLDMKLEDSQKHIKYLQRILEENQKAYREMENKLEHQNRLADSAFITSLEAQIALLKQENSELILSKNSAQEEIKELDLQLAHLLGHQNHKQKIRHVEQLKLEHRNMKEEIEKLTTELMRERKRNKENSSSGSPKTNKTTKNLAPANTRPSASNVSVLKDRNL